MPRPAGLIFVCILPSTVQSSIAFTSIARGNVAAALCSASVSNLFGMVLTPLFVVLLLGSKSGGFSTSAMESIALQLLLPFVLGYQIWSYFVFHKRVNEKEHLEY